MATSLIALPATGGKTHNCIQRIRQFRLVAPIASVRVVVPDVIHAGAFNHALARAGGALGVHVWTFDRLNAELLAQTGRPAPQLSEAAIQQVVAAAVARREAELRHYDSIAGRPGFVGALADLLAELKRAHLTPDAFQTAVAPAGARLLELADLFAEYESVLADLDWLDPTGLALAALEALGANTELAADWPLLIVDGFDDFDRARLAILGTLAQRVGDLMITLPYDPQNSDRLPFRRSGRTLERLQTTIPGLRFDEPEERPARPAALEAIAAGIFEANTPDSDPGETVAFLVARNMAHEAREALRWVKARRMRDGLRLEECAIVADNLAPYAPHLELAAHEFGLQVRFAGGLPLHQNPLVAAVLTLLALPVRDWPWRSMADIVRSPYFDLSRYELQPEHAEALVAVARHGVVIAGLEQWREVFDALAASEAAADTNENDEDIQSPLLPTGQAARDLYAGLAGLIEAVAPPARGTQSEYVGWLEQVLGPDGFDVVGQLETDESEATVRDLAAWQVWREVLDELLFGDTLFEPRRIAYARFFELLRGAVEAARNYPAQRSEKRIELANLNQVRGQRFAAVALLGLAEGVFPRPLREDPFISDAERAEWNLPLEPSLRNDQPDDFYLGLTRADRYLLLTRPALTDTGETWEPSPYWEAALQVFDGRGLLDRRAEALSFVDASSPTELLQLAAVAGTLPAPFEDMFGAAFARLQQATGSLLARLHSLPVGPHEGDLTQLDEQLAERFGAEHVWSPSRLERYGECGYWFYTANVLELEESADPVTGYDIVQRGAMLHTILERVYQAASDPADPESVVAALPDVAARVFAEAPERYQFRVTALWPLQQQEMLAALEATINALADEGPRFVPQIFEAFFGIGDTPPLVVETDSGPVQLRGAIDRVDRAADGALRVVDYKSGTGGLNNKALVEGRKLQLPLYALAAAQALQLGKAVEGLYWNILKAEPASLRLTRFKYSGEVGTESALALAVQHVERHIGNIRAGRFQPEPPPGGCPTYCPARHFCWRYTPKNF